MWEANPSRFTRSKLQVQALTVTPYQAPNTPGSDLSLLNLLPHQLNDKLHKEDPMSDFPHQIPQAAPATLSMAVRREVVGERREFMTGKSQRFENVVNLAQFLNRVLHKVGGHRLHLGVAPVVAGMTPGGSTSHPPHHQLDQALLGIGAAGGGWA